jgi:hypothetical protein
MALRSGGGGNVSATLTTLGVVQSNLDADANPTVNDDTTLGYAMGSYWHRGDTGAEFSCYDPADGAALWVRRSLPSLKSGGYISPCHVTSVASTTVAATPPRCYVPFWLPEIRTFDRIGFVLGTAQASNEARVAIYDSDADGYPAAQIVAPQAISLAAGSGTFVSATISWSNPRPGLFWGMVMIKASGGTQVTVNRIATVTPGWVHVTSGTGASNMVTAGGDNPRFYTSSEAYGSDPTGAPTVTSAHNSDCPLLRLRAA